MGEEQEQQGTECGGGTWQGMHLVARGAPVGEGQGYLTPLCLTPRYKVFHAWVYVTKVGERGIEVEMTYKIEGHLPKPEFKAVSSAVHIEVLKALRGRGVELAAAARLEALKGARGFSGCQDLQE